MDSVPEKYVISLLAFEDRYYFLHPGVNPASLARALFQNIKAGEITSGGSTITMQVIRLSRKNKPRTIWQKLVESYLALRLEITSSKEKILTLYASNAPYGGNVVGLETAAWRYFGTSPTELTWAEAAMLAVLPNAPSLVHPGKNREALKVKRDQLLETLYERQKIDSITLRLSLEEALPEKPLPLPNEAPHFTEWVRQHISEKQFHTTIDKTLQHRVNDLVSVRQNSLSANKIHNMACLVIEVETGEVLSYTGNSRADTVNQHGQYVDVIRAMRSTGSILKPFLFAGMLDNGNILQTHLVPDVPIRYNGYAPKNYDRGYSGAVPAYKALERSLNIPAVILLRKYGVEPFLSLLRNLGFTSFKYDHEHYGLTLILGGAETSLWELAGIYGSLARVLNHYTQSDGNYFPGDYHMPVVTSATPKAKTQSLQEEGLLSASSIYLTFQSLLEVNRPEELSLWYLLSSSRKIAWKTGTSYGSRDAWAVGVTPEYVVAVWAGNADGEGRAGLSGITAAAPLMFDIFSILPETSWFQSPLDDLREVVICRKSGYLAGKNCEETDTIQVVPKGSLSEVCPYHQIVHLDASEEFRVNSDCYPVSRMQKRSWFILPPLQDWYYRRNDISYRPLPPMLEGCEEDRTDGIQIVYPERNSNIVIPRELDGTMGKVVLEIAHRQPGKKVFWHLDGSFIATTSGNHKLAWDMPAGTHELTVVDEDGIRKSIRFEVLE